MNSRRLARLLALLGISSFGLGSLAATPAFAGDDVRFADPYLLPAAPTDADEVSVRLVAYCNRPEVYTFRQGNAIHIEYEPVDCGILGTFIDFRVPLGYLPTGTYTIHLRPVTNVLPIGGAERTFTVGACGGTACLQGGRFSVEASHRISQDSWGIAKAGYSTGETASLWFFSPYNLELTVKVLDGCALNGHWWVFAAGLTNLEVDLTVIDHETGIAKTYRRPHGPAFAPIQDTTAFACE